MELPYQDKDGWMVADEVPIVLAIPDNIEFSPNMKSWICPNCGLILVFYKKQTDSIKLQLVLDHKCNTLPAKAIKEK